MKDTGATGNYYTIGHIVQFSGLTDRTIRNYISSGILEGEKINGVWHFSPEQVDAFIRHPAVRPSIQAKKNSIIYDYLLDMKKQTRQACIILDLPDSDPKIVAEFFCYNINNGDFSNLRFSFESVTGMPRVILKGDAEDVTNLVNRFYHR